MNSSGMNSGTGGGSGHGSDNYTGRNNSNDDNTGAPNSNTSSGQTHEIDLPQFLFAQLAHTGPNLIFRRVEAPAEAWAAVRARSETLDETSLPDINIVNVETTPVAYVVEIEPRGVVTQPGTREFLTVAWLLDIWATETVRDLLRQGATGRELIEAQYLVETAQRWVDQVREHGNFDIPQAEYDQVMRMLMDQAAAYTTRHQLGGNSVQDFRDGLTELRRRDRVLGELLENVTDVERGGVIDGELGRARDALHTFLDELDRITGGLDNNATLDQSHEEFQPLGATFIHSQQVFEEFLTTLTDLAGPGPATASVVSALPTMKLDTSKLDSNGKANCPICLETLALGTEVTELPCQHWYCRSCINTWLGYHDSCPQCRHGIMPANENEIESDTSPQASEAIEMSSGGADGGERRRGLTLHFLPFRVGSNQQATSQSSTPAGSPFDLSRVRLNVALGMREIPLPQWLRNAWPRRMNTQDNGGAEGGADDTEREMQ